MMGQRRNCKRKCKFCNNYMDELERCKFCHFELDEDYNPWSKDNWDIFKINDDEEWGHIQILDRLHYKGVECLFADVWFDDNMAFLTGSKGSNDEIADALNIHKEVIYNDYEHGLVILNLFQEKYLRGMLE